MASSHEPHDNKPKLLDRVRSACRVRGYSLHTERAYCQWTKRYVLHHGTRHPREMGAAEVRSYLTYLAKERDVAASTQNQALSALLFLYQDVLDIDLGEVGTFVRAKRPNRLPVVLTRAEVARVLHATKGEARLAASLLYGAGLRRSEVLRLRVKDLDSLATVKSSSAMARARKIAASCCRPPLSGASSDSSRKPGRSMLKTSKPATAQCTYPTR